MPALPSSQFQSVFRISKNVDAISPSQFQTSRRNRQTISCLACRARKLVFPSPPFHADSFYHRLKCDRQTPCNSCTKRGEQSACTYAQHAPAVRCRRDEAPKSSEAQLRLHKLEEMVTALMGSNKPASSSRSETLSIRALTTPGIGNMCPGHLDVSVLEPTYIGATHWESILENVRRLEKFLSSAWSDIL